MVQAACQTQSQTRGRGRQSPRTAEEIVESEMGRKRDRKLLELHIPGIKHAAGRRPQSGSEDPHHTDKNEIRTTKTHMGDKTSDTGFEAETVHLWMPLNPDIRCRSLTARHRNKEDAERRKRANAVMLSWITDKT